MPKYRKKPVIIEAMQLTKSNYIDCECWINTNDGNATSKFWGKIKGQLVRVDYIEPWEKITIDIETLEGTMTADECDFIIQGVNGEFYPCKPDIFEKTYDLVTE